MKISLKRLGLGFTIGITTMFFGLILQPRMQNAWLRYSGAVIVNGKHTHTYTDKPFRFLTITGERWNNQGELKPASAYHALIVFPSASIENLFGTSSSNGLSRLDTGSWLVKKNRYNDEQETKEIAIKYDALRQTVTLESKTYSLSNGNLFVIRFDRTQQTEVIQFDAIVKARVDVDMLENLYKSLLPDDNVISGL